MRGLFGASRVPRLDPVSRPPLQRSRTSTKPTGARRPYPIGTPNHGVSPNTGPIASAHWLVARDLYPKEPRWFVEIDLDAFSRTGDDAQPTRFRIEIYAEEWGFVFTHAGRVSWIRVTDTRFAHGPDEHELLDASPKLGSIGAFLKTLEARFGIRFDREHPRVRTNIEDAEQRIASWVARL